MRRTAAIPSPQVEIAGLRPDLRFVCAPLELTGSACRVRHIATYDAATRDNFSPFLSLEIFGGREAIDQRNTFAFATTWADQFGELIHGFTTFRTLALETP